MSLTRQFVNRALDVIVVSLRRRQHDGHATATAVEEEGMGSWRRGGRDFCIDFSKQPKFEKATHPDAFPANKDKFLTTVKPIELENWKTRSKNGYWGILFNTCIKYDGQLVVELQKICEISR